MIEIPGYREVQNATRRSTCIPHSRTSPSTPTSVICTGRCTLRAASACAVPAWHGSARAANRPPGALTSAPQPARSSNRADRHVVVAGHLGAIVQIGDRERGDRQDPAVRQCVNRAVGRDDGAANLRTRGPVEGERDAVEALLPVRTTNPVVGTPCCSEDARHRQGAHEDKSWCDTSRPRARLGRWPLHHRARASQTHSWRPWPSTARS